MIDQSLIEKLDDYGVYGDWNIVFSFLEEQNVNVAYYIVIMVLRDSKMLGTPFEDTIELGVKACTKYSKYADEIDKYLMLV